MTAPQLGCIADDHTGGTDVAAGLRRVGIPTALLFGVPDPDQPLPRCRAVVVALKTRTVPPADAVAQSLAAQRWLDDRGVPTTYFKYCSTFDSTDAGNIGPVTDALLDATGSGLTLVCPASPEHGRTVYQGHHFVGATLLSESPMRHHPLTPMTDPDLVRVLGRQTPHPVGLLPLTVVRAGVAAAREHLDGMAARGVRHVVVDVTEDDDLLVAAAAGRDLPVLTGGAGLARAFGSVVLGADAPVPAPDLHGSLPAGPGLVLAGSCSAATLEQIDLARGRFPTHRLDPVATPDPQQLLETATTWLTEHLGRGPLLIHASAPADEQRAAVAAMGPDTAAVLERTLGRLARTAVDRGVRRIVVAGGETSGAVTAALGVRTVLVAGEEDVGVPWCLTEGTDGEPALALLLKSGNFGRPDLLVRAMDGATP
ncbi:3-oxo-tetronate kinase [Nakamurella leprariae]|uniref:3-oxo-tetronate kinase n=1 Tax=Nakamurella leprariae TaxID=2803911 RepID=A0A939C3D8_9ACTN|nr:3-oxo-tetronate kinase [Nakamurella leprariae]MBM9469314.1 four-carbon acid sugar kinase family protein [Nakamurella leprariae]